MVGICLQTIGICLAYVKQSHGHLLTGAVSLCLCKVLREVHGYTAAVADTLAERLKRLRKARGWTLDDIADESGVDRGTISRIEVGRIVRPHRSTLMALAGAFEVPASTLSSNKPRLLEKRNEPAVGRQGGATRIEDRLADLFSHIGALEERARGDFIRAVVALLVALEHTSPAASSGATANDDN